MDGLVALRDHDRRSSGCVRVLARAPRDRRGLVALPPPGRPRRDREGSEVREPRSHDPPLRLAQRLPGQVRARVLEALFGKPGLRPTPGFFDPDNFTFGTPLRRSALEAAIVGVEGVEAVTGIEIRAHGATQFSDFEALAFEVADDELIRVENSALRPERGSVTLEMEGEHELLRPSPGIARSRRCRQVSRRCRVSCEAFRRYAATCFGRSATAPGPLADWRPSGTTSG